jgi:hypothetical protein
MENPKDELCVNSKLKEERNVSDDSYAIKLVERAFFVFIGAICLAFIAYLLKLVWPS